MFSPASYDRLKAADSNPVAATDAQLAPCADRYFEYDAEQRVLTTKLDGGTRTLTYSYTTTPAPIPLRQQGHEVSDLVNQQKMQKQ